MRFLIMHKFLSSKIKFNFLEIIASPWLLAIIPTLIISFLLPELFNKYNLALKQQVDRESYKTLIFFEDIDGNNIKDEIEIQNYRNLFASCFYQANGALLKKQFNFYGKLPQQENLNIPIYNDINNDNVKELFVFTQSADSLFINAVDFKSSKVILYGQFVSKIGTGTEAKDFVLRPIINHDYNNDGVDEMYFLLNAGFSLVPRKIMAYDFINNNFLSSINTGSQHFVTAVKTANNKLLLISTTKPTDNCPSDFPFPYRDDSSRIFGFNDKLELAFKPISFEGIKTRVYGPVVYNNELHFYVLDEANKAEKNYILSINYKGNFIKKNKCSKIDPENKIFVLLDNGEQHYIVDYYKNNFLKFCEYNPNKMIFETNGYSKSLPNASLIPFKFDNIENGSIGVNNKTNKASLYLDNFKHELKFDSNLYLKSWNFYAQTKKIKEGRLIVLTDKYFLYTYLLTNAVYYPYRFLLFLTIYILSVGFIFLPQKLRKQHLLKKEKLQKEISTLQLQLVNSKLDPHFTFNALNTVSAKVLKGERFEAYDLMTNFSNMMRSAMLFSDKDSWSLSDELKFTENYLTLMKGRFKNRFNFVVEVEENIEIEHLVIPRLIVQNFTENAVKHAFVGVNYIGLVKIIVKVVNNTFEILITDNGIGREKAKINTEKDVNKSGNGIRLNKKQVEIYNKLYTTNITIEILDLFKNNCALGTQIRILIPAGKV